MSSIRHHQGPNAAVKVWSWERSEPVKVRELQKKLTVCDVQGKSRGFIATGAMIVKKESPLGLYKGESTSTATSHPGLTVDILFDEFQVLEL
jgi:hypothetical protein